MGFRVRGERFGALGFWVGPGLSWEQGVSSDLWF